MPSKTGQTVDSKEVLCSSKFTRSLLFGERKWQKCCKNLSSLFPLHWALSEGSTNLLSGRDNPFIHPPHKNIRERTADIPMESFGTDAWQESPEVVLQPTKPCYDNMTHRSESRRQSLPFLRGMVRTDHRQMGREIVSQGYSIEL